MVTIKDMRDNVMQFLQNGAAYLNVNAGQISKGLSGENADDVFTTDEKFIRFYTAPEDPDPKAANHPTTHRKCSLTVLCGWYDTDPEVASMQSLELAERVERLLIARGIPRKPIKIFVFENKNGLSIHAVPFYFVYSTSAGDPDA